MRIRLKSGLIVLMLSVFSFILICIYLMDNKGPISFQAEALTEVNRTVDYEVHAFYYLWYGNPQLDGNYYHWSHSILPHWNPVLAMKWPKGRHVAPDDIGSNFYPQLGCYSSIDVQVVRQHLRWMQQAGIGTIVVSWYPAGKSDTEGLSRDGFTSVLLTEAETMNLKVTFLIEPYDTRSARSVVDDVRYILDSYGGSSAFYRYQGKPMFYVYDSYLIPKEDWHAMLKINSSANGIRGSKYDSIMLALVVQQIDASNILSSGFDGFFTYFASDGFSYGSSTGNWKMLARFAKTHGLITSFSVGPGYIDERIRPWNEATTRHRENGGYYEKMWNAAVEAGSPILSITSFNEWHEGTQIEPATPYTAKGYTYMDYGVNGPLFYLELTGRLVDRRRKDLQKTM